MRNLFFFLFTENYIKSEETSIVQHEDTFQNNELDFKKEQIPHNTLIKSQWSLPSLYNEKDYPEDLLPSDKKKRRGLVLLDKIISAGDLQSVFWLFYNYKDDVQNQHITGVFIAINDLVEQR